MTDTARILEAEPTLSELDDAARQARFEALQQRMESVWDAMKLDLEDESVVILPSVSLSSSSPAAASLMQAFEERFLFLLLLLRSRGCAWSTSPRWRSTAGSSSTTWRCFPA